MCHLLFRAGELVGGNMSSCYSQLQSASSDSAKAC
jgi:hypothetical protein